ARLLRSDTVEFEPFLNDVDEVTPNHLPVLYSSARETAADVTYGWYEVIGGADPRPDRFGVPFDPDELRRGSYIHTATLVRTKLLQAAGGLQHTATSKLDDWGAWLAMLDMGASF